MPIPTVLAKYALPVVVAPPLIVSPPVLVPSPIVEEPYASKLVAKRLVAVSPVDEAYGNCEANLVDDAKKTPCVQIEEVVAAVDVLKVEAKSNALRPEM